MSDMSDRTPPKRAQEEQSTWDRMKANVTDMAAAGAFGRGAALIGGMLQPSLDTPGYRLRQQQLANAYYDAEHKREWDDKKRKQGDEEHDQRMANAWAANERAEAANARAQESHDYNMKQAREGEPYLKRKRELDLANAELRNDEARKNVELSDELRELNVQKAKMQKRELVYAQESAQVTKNLLASLGDLNLTSKEMDEFQKSPTFQRNVRLLVLGRQLLRSYDDPEAWADAKDQIRLLGGEVIEQPDKNGETTYSVRYAKDKPPIPLNEGTFMQLTDMMKKELQQEAQDRQALSFTETRGNVFAKVIATEANRLIPYMGGSATKALAATRQALESLPEKYRRIMAARRTLDDYFSKGVPEEDKMAEIEQIIGQDADMNSILSRMGYAYSGGEDNVADATIMDGQGHVYSLPDFWQKLKEMDEGTRILNTQFSALQQAEKTRVAIQLARGMKNQLDRQDSVGQEQKFENQSIQRTYDMYGEAVKANPNIEQIIGPQVEAYNAKHPKDQISPDEVKLKIATAHRVATQDGVSAEGDYEAYYRSFVRALNDQFDDEKIAVSEDDYMGNEERRYASRQEVLGRQKGKLLEEMTRNLDAQKSLSEGHEGVRKWVQKLADLKGRRASVSGNSQEDRRKAANLDDQIQYAETMLRKAEEESGMTELRTKESKLRRRMKDNDRENADLQTKSNRAKSQKEQRRKEYEKHRRAKNNLSKYWR